MPYENQFATGDSLIALDRSESVRNFDGIVAERIGNGPSTPPPIFTALRRNWIPKYVIAIDGSNITHRVKNGFPGAEAGLVLLSVLIIDISKLASARPDEIIRPSVFHEMEKVHALDAILPGANVVRRNVEKDSPKAFFREKVFDAFCGRLDNGHETLLDTFQAITSTRRTNFRCPVEDCNNDISINEKQSLCSCDKKEKIFQTDSLRFHERFNEIGSNNEVHGEVRHVLEILSMINIMRFFAASGRAKFFRDAAFVLDGPLGVFGQPAWIMPYVRNEVGRINQVARKETGEDIVFFGVEKTGQFMTHFEDIDWTDSDGPRTKYPPATVITPDTKYVHKNIVFRPEDAKAYGKDTYFGRKVLYKTKSRAHTVINTAILNEAGEEFSNITAEAFPRLGDTLDVMDHLSTYLYQDGFMPLVRAHAHAAIPLERGSRILEKMIQNNMQNK